MKSGAVSAGGGSTYAVNVLSGHTHIRMSFNSLCVESNLIMRDSEIVNIGEHSGYTVT